MKKKQVLLLRSSVMVLLKSCFNLASSFPLRSLKTLLFRSFVDSGRTRFICRHRHRCSATVMKKSKCINGKNRVKEHIRKGVKIRCRRGGLKIALSLVNRVCEAATTAISAGFPLTSEAESKEESSRQSQSEPRTVSTSGRQRPLNGPTDG